MNIIRKNAFMFMCKTNSPCVTRYLPISGCLCSNNQTNTILPRQSLATHAIDSQNSTFINNLKKKFGWGNDSKTRIRMSSYIIYESVADKINYPLFFEYFKLPDTFNSWFLITELHTWMLLVRAMGEGSETGQDGRFMRNCIVEAMWSDVNKRAKKLGVQNPSAVREQIQILSQQFQAALIAYDEAIMSDDRRLAGVLWLRFFERDCDDYTKLEDLVKYVRKQTKLFDSLSREDFLVKPKIEWIELPEK